MELELWYLIIVPVLFAAGWFLRGFDARQRQEENKDLPDNYFRGLSLLLSNEPDKAIDAFIEVAKVDSETVELHHALGNLFCRRGEFERAIRIHTHLINRADLSDEDRLRALSELALDYLKAGIYDKAIECYEKLSGSPSYHLEALRQLLKIRCTEHDWTEAIAAAKRLEKEASEDHSADIAHFHCERAEEAARSKNIQAARAEINAALAVRPRAPRALMLKGDMLAQEGDDQGAVEAWNEIRRHSPDHYPLVVSRLVKTYEKMGKQNEAEAVLREALEKFPSAEVVDLAMNEALACHGEKAAAQVVSEAMEGHPSLGILSIAMELRNRLNPEDKQLQGLTALLKKESDRQGRFQCRKCGFLSHSYLWQCPGCGEWDTYPTLRVQDQASMKK
ncbi:lipopolysaccharide assembly protein LapB [Mesosutterella sp. AGMB02718]|uniref:Lipopolysaccharide assembly protein B n=1 Tax=Mesosutterella faecium TaxID=2925194 RepID=A0ABT7IMI7_9BURK|nr:lipopolysaccharide assembly protein LapB [Mesosutterella sp. AGMB02718]MDL2059131.1 lipopolysaccharide assembly protein LapB [Mesosutterella sp. AGMB02718]